MALKDDPKVQELIAKEVAKAVKAESKRALDLVKNHFADVVSSIEDKATQKHTAAVGKGVLAALKSPV